MGCLDFANFQELHVLTACHKFLYSTHFKSVLLQLFFSPLKKMSGGNSCVCFFSVRADRKKCIAALGMTKEKYVNVLTAGVNTITIFSVYFFPFMVFLGAP